MPTLHIAFIAGGLGIYFWFACFVGRFLSAHSTIRDRDVPMYTRADRLPR
jgi:hypothetical protein